ncbi:MAG TPA: 5-deoxy-glucuronate isomerase [Pseudonocardiaceae bacterium]|nr:5-deoxy-glucuronate isomerase [Pseudonocardiaceae bacterium]
MPNSKLHLPAGSTAEDGWSLVITPETAGWTYSGLRVLDLAAGQSRRLSTGEDEVLVLPLSGSCSVTCEGETFELAGRANVFSGVSDFAYLPRDATATVSSAAGAKLALPAARAQHRLTPRYAPAEQVPVELRGAGQCSRQVNNFCTPESFDADQLIACEVLTPAGNWSSYPPHKHDEDRPGEAVLEEIYYFEVAGGPGGPGVGYQRAYGHPGKEIDVLAEVRSGDSVLLPHGWHGPSMAAPGNHLYYLNVMAGPGSERAWLVCDDPAHGWVRETWRDQAIDPRLPLTQAVRR